MLKDIITHKLVCLDYEASDWEMAVRKSGMLLKSEAFVEQAYVDEMVNTVKKMGPYIVISKGIALPHARPSQAVHKVGVSIVRVKRPIDFGSETNDPVKLIFAICSTDNNAHLELLSELSQLIGDKACIDYLNVAQSGEAVAEFLKRK